MWHNDYSVNCEISSPTADSFTSSLDNQVNEFECDNLASPFSYNPNKTKVPGSSNPS